MGNVVLDGGVPHTGSHPVGRQILHVTLGPAKLVLRRVPLRLSLPLFVGRGGTEKRSGKWNKVR